MWGNLFIIRLYHVKCVQTPKNVLAIPVWAVWYVLLHGDWKLFWDSKPTSLLPLVLQKCAAACFGFSCEVCTLKCSTENGPGVSLSWYIGSERLNQTSSSELNVNLSLPLEIKERNIDMYQCVAANPVSNQTTQFSFQEHCPPYTG